MDISMEQNDVGDQIHVTNVVTTEDGSHMVTRVASTILNIEEHLHKAIGINAITSAVHILNISTIVATINGDVNKDVGLDGQVSGIAIGAMFIVISAVTTAVNSVDIRCACDSDVSIDFLTWFCRYQRSVIVGSRVVGIRQYTVGDAASLAQTVIASIECAAIGASADAATSHPHLVAAVNGGHIAAAIHIAFHFAANHTNRSQPNV